jgi:hypothetical protein
MTESMQITGARRDVLRELARRYAEIAALPRQQETIKGWRRLNGLQPIRPMVRLDQLPWRELPWGGQHLLGLDGVADQLEVTLRKTLYAWEHFPADMVVLPQIPLPKTVLNARPGPGVRRAHNIGLSVHYQAQIKTMDDVEALRTPPLAVDPEGDARRLEAVNEALDGIVTARLTGRVRHSGLWDMITMAVEPEQVLYDLADRPEFLAALIAKYVAMESELLDKCEELGLLEPAPAEVHCTGAFSDELPSKGCDGKRVTAADTWTLSMAQIFSEVSPAMHDAFDIQPLKPLLERYGLVYYGCCEPLHHKIDIIRQIRTVRKISVSPWAKKEVAAESIHGDYVFSAKPNPSYVAMPSFDEELIRRDLEETVEICRRHRTPCELILKDVSTVLDQPGRLTAWERIAMEVAGA